MAIWHEDTVDQREAMVLLWLSGRYTGAEVAARFETTRTTLYSWTRRYRNGGRAGLVDRPPVAQTCPHKTPAPMVARIVAARQQYGWGPKKLYARLREVDPTTAWPQPSTIGDILRRQGLVAARPRRRATAAPFRRVFEPRAAGDVMTVDFKGQFRTRDGQYCYPLTMMERVSRYLLACEALESTAFAGVWPVFQRVFREYGVPQAMQSDNGVPFASPHSLSGISRLSVQLMKLGVQPVLNTPGRPDQNGAHERMHRELKRETTRPPERNRRAQQRRFDRFRQVYNHERPHEALAQTPPARHFTHTRRPYPERPATLTYPSHVDVRKVSSSGELHFHGHPWFVSEALAGEYVGLEAVGDGIWSVQFHRFELGRVDERDGAWT
jgi:transposase InsO family protein